MAMQGSRQLKMLARGIEYVISSKSMVDRTEIRRPLMIHVLQLYLSVPTHQMGQHDGKEMTYTVPKLNTPIRVNFL